MQNALTQSANSIQDLKEGDIVEWITTLEHLIEDAVPVTDKVISANDETFAIAYVNDRNHTIQMTFRKSDGMSWCGTRKAIRKA